MAYSFPKVLAMLDQLIDIIETGDCGPLLTAKGIDPVTIATPLKTMKTALTQLNTAQEQLKDALSNKTKELESSLDSTYVAASSQMDMLIGMAGKRSALAGTLREIRKSGR
jgi:exonuclease VII small subunit